MAKAIKYAVLHKAVFTKEIGQLPVTLETKESATFAKNRDFTMRLENDSIVLRLKESRSDRYVEVVVPMTNVSHYILDVVEVR